MTYGLLRAKAKRLYMGLRCNTVSRNTLSNANATVYAFDATTIVLCLSVYPWAPFRAHKAASKATIIISQLPIEHWQA